MRESRSWIFLAVGLLLAALTGLSLYGIARQNAPAAQSQDVRTVEVVVAKVDIPVRTVITVDLIARKSHWLKAAWISLVVQLWAKVVVFRLV